MIVPCSTKCTVQLLELIYLFRLSIGSELKLLRTNSATLIIGMVTWDTFTWVNDPRPFTMGNFGVVHVTRLSLISDVCSVVNWKVCYFEMGT